MDIVRLIACAICCYVVQSLYDYILSFIPFFNPPQQSVQIVRISWGKPKGRQRPFLSVTLSLQPPPFFPSSGLFVGGQLVCNYQPLQLCLCLRLCT